MFSCGNSGNQQNQKIEKVVLKQVDFSVMTIISVECEKYEEYFSDQYKIKEIKNSNDVNGLMQHLQTLEPIDSTYSSHVDVRAKVEIYYADNISTICLGNLSIKKDGKIYKNTPEIKEYINRL